MRWRGTTIFTCAGILLGVGCGADDPADVARLTIRNVAAMARMLERDTTCGFASDAARATGELAGMVGERGRYVERVEACAIDLGLGRIIERDCTSAAALGMGRVVLSARRVLAGTVGGGADSPIALDGSESYAVHIDEARFEHFEVTLSDSRKSLRMVDGMLSALVMPRLAASGGAQCAAVTPHLAFADVRYAPSTLVLDSDDRRAVFSVASSNLAAQRGYRAGSENRVEGQLSFSDRETGFLGPAKLEEGYEREAFDARHACEDTAMAQPLGCREMEDSGPDAGLTGIDTR